MILLSKNLMAALANLQTLWQVSVATTWKCHSDSNLFIVLLFSPSALTSALHEIFFHFTACTLTWQKSTNACFLFSCLWRLVGQEGVNNASKVLPYTNGFWIVFSSSHIQLVLKLCSYVKCKATFPVLWKTPTVVLNVLVYLL